MSRIFNKLRYEREKLITRLNAMAGRLMRHPEVRDIDTTIDTIISRRASIARFGDGEFDIIFGRFQGFQHFDYELSRRLREVLKANGRSDTFLVGIPDCYGDLSHFTPQAQYHWKIRLDRERWKWYRILNRKAPYYQAQISRFYFDWADKSRCLEWAEKLKSIWAERNLLIIEGSKSRLGLGNDLFDRCRSVRRLLCPATEAFKKYDEILNAAIQLAKADDLILIALGPTASVLAYDLHEKGFQAIDIGHVDLEYEWMKMNATEKVNIPGRYNNEVAGGNIVDDSAVDGIYLSQIVKEIPD